MQNKSKMQKQNNISEQKGFFEMLQPIDSQRYLRQMTLSGFGEAGQAALQAARVLLIGVGGLGCPAALYLAAAGVGTMGLMDGDTVSLLNLHRQILYTDSEIGMPKVTCAANALHRCNSSVTIQTYPVMADADNLPELVRQYDIVLDCTDHLPTKFLINDVCVAERVAYVHGGILAYQGQIFTYVPEEPCPCYRCLFEAPPEEGAVPTCKEVGVLGAVAGVIGNLQALEAIRYLTHVGELLTGRLLSFDFATMKTRTVSFPKNPHCIGCGTTERS